MAHINLTTEERFFCIQKINPSVWNSGSLDDDTEMVEKYQLFVLTPYIEQDY
jgi:hypothetical protein